MPRTPMIPWIVVLVVMVVIAAVIFVTGQIVGHMFPLLREMAGDSAQIGLFPIIEDTMLVWLPIGLVSVIVLWAVIYSFLYEAYRRGVR